MDIKNNTRQKTPAVEFEKIKKYTLGDKYELSLVFIGAKLSKKLNKTYRRVNKPTNVLSFPLSKSVGEIFINLNLSRKQAQKLGRSYNRFIGFLFIHGLLHLKGYPHSSKMEKEEKRIREKFGL